MDFNTSSYICGYDNISSKKVWFQGPELKVKVGMTGIFSVMWGLIPLSMKIWMFTILYLNVKVIYGPLHLRSHALCFFIHIIIICQSHNYYMSWHFPVQCLLIPSSLVRGDLYCLRCLVSFLGLWKVVLRDCGISWVTSLIFCHFSKFRTIIEMNDGTFGLFLSSGMSHGDCEWGNF